MVERDDDDDDNPFAAPESDLVSRESDDDFGDGERSHQIIDAGDVISTSWAIFKVDYGITIGAVFLANILMQVFAQAQNVLSVIAEALRQQGDDSTASILIVLAYCCIPVSFAVQCFVQLGQARLLLNVARGEQAQISDLFSGGRYFWRMFGATILFSLMVGFGMLACLIPGIIWAMMYFSYVYALVDEDPRGMQCLSLARAAAKDNLGAILVLFIASIGINILGFLMFCVGIIATVPLTALILAVAYCKMTGQRTAKID